VTVRIGTTDVSVLRQVLHECHYDVDLPFSPKTILDAGANIGLAAVYFANRYPDATIVAVEPDESNVQILRENTASYPHIRVIQGALWNRDMRLRLFDPGAGHHGFQVSGTPQSTDASVQGFRVDTLMREMGWSSLDLLKVDIEGAELEVFADSEAWKHAVNACMAELHDDIKPGCTEAFTRAVAAFECRTLRGESEITWRAGARTKPTDS
jgi:FkbM family methyltransferase